MSRQNARFEIPESWTFPLIAAAGVMSGLNWAGLRNGDKLVAWAPLGLLALGIAALACLDYRFGVRIQEPEHRLTLVLGFSCVALITKWLTIPIWSDERLRLYSFSLLVFPLLALLVVALMAPLRAVSADI